MSDFKFNQEHIENIIQEKDYVLDQAKQANQLEHVMPLREVLKAYKKAILWSMLLSACIIMEGYDTYLMGNMYALPSFTEKYGTYYPEVKKNQIPAKWQSALGNAGACGAFLGSMAQGYLVSKFGYRKVILSAMIWTAGTIFLFFFAINLGMLVAAQVLFGLTSGMFSTMGIAYASEICPTQIRGYLTEFIEMCWASGELVAIGVLKGFASNPQSKWAYKVPFAIQWAWIPVLFVPLIFVPENPWWLCRVNRLEDAEKTLRRIVSKESGIDPKMLIADMVHVLEQESLATQEASYIECFKGINLRRTEIVCAVYVSQLFCNSIGSPTFFFSMAGISSSVSFDLGLALQAISWICTIFSFILITYIGRRPLFVFGAGFACLLTFIIGFMSLDQDRKSIQYGQAGIVFVVNVTYRLTVGPLTTTLVGETSSMKLRSQSVALARSSYYLGSLATQTLSSYMISGSAWNWRGKVGFYYAVMSFLAFTWAYFRLPECKDRTPEELDILFNNKISARKFTRYNVDPFGEVQLTLKERYQQS